MSTYLMQSSSQLCRRVCRLCRFAELRGIVDFEDNLVDAQIAANSAFQRSDMEVFIRQIYWR